MSKPLAVGRSWLRMSVRPSPSLQPPSHCPRSLPLDCGCAKRMRSRCSYFRSWHHRFLPAATPGQGVRTEMSQRKPPRQIAPGRIGQREAFTIIRVFLCFNLGLPPTVLIFRGQALLNRLALHVLRPHAPVNASAAFGRFPLAG